MTLTAAAPLTDLTEKEWSTQVVELAKTLGYERYHTYRSDRSTPGWPDEALVRERLILLELKGERGRLSDAQKHWIRALLHTDVEIYLARPSDLQLLANVLACRGNPFDRRGDVREAAAQLRHQTTKAAET